MEKESNIRGRGLLNYTPHGDEERLRACYMEAIETLAFGPDPASPSSSLGTHLLQLCCDPRMRREILRTYQRPSYDYNRQSYDSCTARFLTSSISA